MHGVALTKEADRFRLAESRKCRQKTVRLAGINKMKVGIITIHSAYNYGAVFQAFALKEYIKNFLGDGSSVSIIDYRTNFFESKKKLNFSKDIVADIIELERLAMSKKLKRRDGCFEAFISENDDPSVRCGSTEELSAVVSDCDLLISGSDQLWNLNVTGGDENYFLNIPNYCGRKISYSSSFGSFRFYKEHEEKFKGFLNDFSALSCREKDGCEYVKTLVGKECVHVCDPTLLLSREKYLKICEGKVRKKIEKLAEKNFLLIYNLSTSKAVLEVAKKIASERSLEVYQIFPSLRKNSAVDCLLNDISPEEFLYLYSKTNFVVTNSFHGTCFSLINNKDFYTVSPTGSSNRLESLLSKAGLADRLLNDENAVSNSDGRTEIDYNAVNQKLDLYIGHSKRFLEDNLSAE